MPPNASAADPQKRRWYHFTVRTLFIVVPMTTTHIATIVVLLALSGCSNNASPKLITDLRGNWTEVNSIDVQSLPYGYINQEGKQAYLSGNNFQKGVALATYLATHIKWQPCNTASIDDKTEPRWTITLYHQDGGMDAIEGEPWSFVKYGNFRSAGVDKECADHLQHFFEEVDWTNQGPVR